MRIELAGALATGKSTLAAAMESLGAKIIREDVSSNPFLPLQRKDPDRWGFACQKRFMEDKLESLAIAADDGAPVAVDYCMEAERAYLEHYLSAKPSQFAELLAFVDESMAGIGDPALIVHLSCSPALQEERIKKRAREFELAHDRAFLSDISGRVRRYAAAAEGRGVPVLWVRTDGMSTDAVMELARSLVARLRDVAPPADAARAQAAAVS